jgi:hypothetical protein
MAPALLQKNTAAKDGPIIGRLPLITTNPYDYDVNDEKRIIGKAEVAHTCDDPRQIMMGSPWLFWCQTRHGV